MGAWAASWPTAKVPCRFRVPFRLLGRRTPRSTPVRYRSLPLLLTPIVRCRDRLFRAAALFPIRARRSQSIGMTSGPWLWWTKMARRKDSKEQIANLAGEVSGMADFPEEVRGLRGGEALERRAFSANPGSCLASSWARYCSFCGHSPAAGSGITRFNWCSRPGSRPKPRP
jgi:hypothetical protein